MPLASDLNPSPYGFCPICGAPAVSRERCPDGNDVCERGHTYPSRDAVPEPGGRRP